MYAYRAFQLLIRSEIECPELLIEDDCLRASDVVVQWGDVDAHGLKKPLVKKLFYQANTDSFWLNVPRVARFLIEKGYAITIHPEPGVDEDSIRVFLLGSCFGALLMQRQALVLHGNAIQVGDGCISFVGHSGAGKSTLSGAFLKRGYPILADDLCVVNSQCHVIPSFPHIKLWLDALNKLNIAHDGFRRIRPNLEKFSVPLGAQFCAQSLPLKTVYVLHTHHQEDVKCLPILGMKKLTPLQNNSYRMGYVKAMQQEKAHFGRTSFVAGHIDMVHVHRPQAGFKLDALVDVIEEDLAHRGLLHALV